MKIADLNKCSRRSGKNYKETFILAQDLVEGKTIGIITRNKQQYISEFKKITGLEIKLTKDKTLHNLFTITLINKK